MREEPNDELTPVEGAPDQEAAPIIDESVETASLPTPTEVEIPVDAPMNEATPDTPGAEPMTPLTHPAEPMVVPVAPVAPAEPVVEPPKKSKKPLWIAVIIAAILALFVGGGALAYNVWYQNPDKVVSDAIVNANTAKSVSATGSLEIKSDDVSLKIEATTKTTVDADAQVGIKLTYAGDDMAVSVDGEGIYAAEGDMYIRVNDLKALVAKIEEESDGMVDFEMFGAVIEKVDSKWVKIGKDDLGEFSEEYEKSQQCVADISKQLDEDASFRRTVEGEVKDLYAEHPFILVGESLGSRDIGGVGSLGYELNADPAVADAFFTGLADTELGSRLQECSEDLEFADIVTEDSKEEMKGDYTAEIWVSRFGHSITEVSLKGTDEDGTEGSLVVNPVFNSDEAVEIPTDVVTLSELKADIEDAMNAYYEDLYGSYFSESTSATEFN